jgi:hypothetical protein
VDTWAQEKKILDCNCVGLVDTILSMEHDLRTISQTLSEALLAYNYDLGVTDMAEVKN